MEKKEIQKEDIVTALRQSGINCRSCWWQEGGLCYVNPCTRNNEGRSIKQANEVCENHTSKRSVLEKVFPKDIIVIQSELNQTK